MNKIFNLFKNKNNIYVFISFLCFFILIFLIVYSNLSNPDKIVEKKILSLFNQLNLSFVIHNLEFINDSSIYNSTIIIEGSIRNIYFNFKGDKIIPFIYPIKNLLIEDNPRQINLSYSNLSLINREKINLFVDCLNSKNLKIYGFSNQEYTIYLAQIFGGFDVIENIYVDCSKNRILCLEEDVLYYPSVKIKNNFVGVEASLDGFSMVSGCAIDLKR